MSKDTLAEQPDVMSWQEHVEGLIVGAMRGMAEAQAAMDAATAGAVPPLTDMTMFEAAELLTATLLEASPACERSCDIPAASRKVGRDVMTYVKGLRGQRDLDGTSTLFNIIDQAGLERQHSH